jgi:hypothetical protein
MDAGMVTLETAAGRVIKLELGLLIETDRALLNEHFGLKAAAAPAAVLEPLGNVQGPVTAEGSSYYYYVPKSLKPGRKVPLLFFTGSGNGNAGRLAVLREGAEVCRWIIAISVECKNGLPDEDYITHTKHCLDHLIATQPIDKARLYFTGNSGGSRVAFTNSAKFKGAGVMAIIAGAQPGEISRNRDYYFINGATDYNRSGSAISFKEAKSSSAFRFHPGSHNDGPPWLQTEGMIWLESRWHARTKGSGPDREDFEAAAMTWAESLVKDYDYRAAWWADYLTISGLLPKAQGRAALLTKEVGGKPTSRGYISGLKMIEELALDVIAEGPPFSPDCFEHTSPKIQKGVDKILVDHAETPWVKEILPALKNKTGRG